MPSGSGPTTERPLKGQGSSPSHPCKAHPPSLIFLSQDLFLLKDVSQLIFFGRKSVSTYRELALPFCSPKDITPLRMPRDDVSTFLKIWDSQSRCTTVNSNYFSRLLFLKGRKRFWAHTSLLPLPVHLEQVSKQEHVRLCKN